MKNHVILSLLLLINVSASSQGLEWAFKTGTVSPNVVVVDKNNYVYVVGNFTAGGDFDPGPGTFNLSSSGSSDIYIQKLTNNRQLLWAKKIGGSGADSGTNISVDQQGNLYVTGYFSGQIDSDPGPGMKPLQTAGDWDAFVLKLDKNGNFLWSASVGGAGTDNGLGITVDPQGQVCVAGYFSGTADFDPGANNFPLFSQGGNDAFVLKLDANGQFVWAGSSGGVGQERGRSIAASPDGSLYIGGDGFLQKRSATGTTQWNFTLNSSSSCTGLQTDQSGNVFAIGYFTGIFQLADTTLNNNNSTSYILQLNPNGNCLLCRTISSPVLVWAQDIDLDAYGNIYCTGSFRGDVDFDPGPGTALMSSSNDFSGYILKLDASGGFKWAIPLQATGSGNRVEASSTALDTRNGIYSVGRFKGTVDMDPGTGTLNLSTANFLDYYYVKISSTVYYQGKVFSDLNNNKIQDPGEPNLPNIIIHARQNDIHISSDDAGIYRFYANIGTDTISLSTSRPYWITTPAFHVIDTSSNPRDFAVFIEPVRDVCISVLPDRPNRPNINVTYIIKVVNQGSLTVNSIPVKFRFSVQPQPSNMIYLSSEPLATLEPNDQYAWLIPTLAPQESKTFLVHCRTPIDAILNSPVTVSSTANIPNDQFPGNNQVRWQTNVLTAFDPNIKQVEPEYVAPVDIDTSTLFYQIHFQNTGNYPAELVFLRDTLPPELDLGSLNFLGSSHTPYTWRLEEGRVLEVRFDPIFLPDSTSNEPESHGFVAFSAKPKPGLSIGDSIRNRVGIYFDYNDPVITNYAVMNVGFLVHTLDAGATGRLNFQLSPNPAAAFRPIFLDLPHDIGSEKIWVQVRDMNGVMVREQAIFPFEGHIRLEGLPTGVYGLQLRSGDLWGIRLLVVQ
jgi:Beta-propeller repeat